MATRITRDLVVAGQVREERDGRVVYVTLAGASSGTSASDPQRPFDRPYVHLVDAAEWALARVPRDPFAQALEVVRAQESAGDVASRRVREQLRALASELDRDPRKLLVDALAEFCVEHERDFLAADLLKAAQGLRSFGDPEGAPCPWLAWVAMRWPSASACALRLAVRRRAGRRATAPGAPRQADEAGPAAPAKHAPAHAAYLEALHRTAQEAPTSLARSERTRLTAVDASDPVVRRMTAQGSSTPPSAARSASPRGSPRAAIHAAERFARERKKAARQPPPRHEEREGRGGTQIEALLDSLRRAAAEPLRLRRIPQADGGVGDLSGSVESARPEEPAQYDRLIRNNFWTPEMEEAPTAITPDDG